MVQLSMQARVLMIADAAYFRAEQRRFQGGDPLADWLEAEAQINRMLAHENNAATVDVNRIAIEERLLTQLNGVAVVLKSLDSATRLGQIALASALTLLFAVLAIIGASAFVVVIFWDRHRLWALASITTVFAFIALLTGWFTVHALARKPSLFSSSLAALTADRLDIRDRPILAAVASLAATSIWQRISTRAQRHHCR